MAFTDPTCPGIIFYEPGDPEFEEVNRESNRRRARTWEYDGAMVMQTMRRYLGIEEDPDPDDDLDDQADDQATDESHKSDATKVEDEDEKKK